MTPPIAQIVAGSAAIKAVIGSAPVRFWSFGEAERDADGNVAAPYAVWQTVYGNPENYLAQVPDADRWGTQVDAYARSMTQARALAALLRDAFEPYAYIVAWNGEFKDTPTGLYRVSFTLEWLTPR